MTDSRAVLDLARRLAALERATKNQAIKPQLGFSSVEGGAIGVNDESGADRGSLGLQYDGTYVAVSRNGPPPPTPDAPAVTGGSGWLRAGWTGNFARDDGPDPLIAAPEDFARVEVHVGATMGFVVDVAPESTTRKATIETAAGADVLVAMPPGDYWVRLVARTVSGAFSPPSVASPVTVAAVISDAALAAMQAELDAAQARLDAAQLDITASATDITAAQARLTTAEVDLTSAFGLIDTNTTGIAAVPTQISVSQQFAIDTAADDASSKVFDATQSLALALGKKGTIYYGDAIPPADPNGLWLRGISRTPNAYVDYGVASGSVNLSTNPLALSGAGWNANDADHSGVTLGVAITGHPLGITTAVRGNVWVAGYDLLTMYNIDTLNGSSVSRGLGVWVMAPSSGCSALLWSNDQPPMTLALTPNVWTWITYPPNPNYAALRITKTGSVVGDVAYATGCIALAGATPPAYFDGGMVGAHWTGTAGASTSATDAGWYPVPDAAIAAAQATANQALSDATTKAAAAEAAAITSATTMTNNINRAYSSTTYPTSGNMAAQGSIWRQLDDSNRIINVWEQTYAGIDSHWTPRLITSEVIDNLDVGKLTASGAVINSAVINKIAASTASIQTADIGNLFVTGTSNLSTVVAQKVAANVGTFISLDVEQLTATGVSTLNEVAAQQIAAKTGAFINLDVSQLTAGTATIGTLVLQKIAAGTGEFVQVKASNILTGTLAAGVEIVAGDPAADHFSMSSTGARAFQASPNPGSAPQEAVSIGTGGPNAFAVLDPVTSETRASVTRDGTMQGRSGIFDDLTVGGTDLLALINALPRGLLAYGEQGADAGPYTTETGYMEIGCTIGAGRMVRVWLRCTAQMTTATAKAFGYRIRATYTTNGSTPPAPTISSPEMLAGAVVPRTDYDFDMHDAVLVRNLTGFDVNVRLLLTGAPSTGGFSFVPAGAGTSYWGDSNPSAGNILAVEDVGPDMSAKSAYTLGSGGGAPPPSQTAPPQTYTRTTPLAWVTQFDQNGVSLFNDGGTYLVSGVDGYNLRNAAYLGFADIIPTGATINALSVYLKNAGGGTSGSATFGNHKLTAKPTSGSPPPVYDGFNRVFANGVAYWLPVNVSAYPLWQSNAYTGVVIGSTSNTSLPWQRFYRSGQYQPVLKVTYTI